MNSGAFYALIGAGLFSLGLHGLILQAELLRKILSINVIGSGVFLLLVGLASQTNPVFPDPLPRAMVITGIVVAVSATALALSLMLRLLRHDGGEDLH